MSPVVPILASWASVSAGQSTRDQFIETACNALHVSRIVVQHIAHVTVAAVAPAQPVAGRVIDDYRDRDAASLRTVTETPEVAQARIERFVTSTLEQYGRDELIDISADFGSSGWIWRTDSDPCDYCAEREGQHYDLGDEFRDHPNCGCYPEPVFDLGYSDHAHDKAGASHE